LRGTEKLVLFPFSEAGCESCKHFASGGLKVETGKTGVAALDGSLPHSAPRDAHSAAAQDGCAAPAFDGTAPAIPTLRKSRHHFSSNGSAGPIYGALDLGTNNCRLLVARPSRRGFFVTDAFSRIIKLGEGVTHTGHLSEEAMLRTIDALKVCSAKMARGGVTRSRLVATEACRIARNGPEFVARVKRETGLSLEIIGRETEARLAVSGCASLIDKQSDYVLIFDIGGGSSEFVWLNLRNGRRSRRISLEDRLRIQDCIQAWTSLPFGVVTLAERFGSSHAEGFQFEEMVSFVQSQLLPFSISNGIAEKMTRSGAHMLGTSGTVTTIAGVYLGLSEYHRAKVDGCWLSADNVRQVTRRIAAMDYRQRAAEPCIGTERADLILAGCAIMEAMLRVWPVKSLRVADRGLREGILATLIAEDAMLERERNGTPSGNSHKKSRTVSPLYDKSRA
jgi:exopolyphosphatase / guanosine-5'-triphosphate,3'-diphosphate pyrophosphatase